MNMTRRSFTSLAAWSAAWCAGASMLSASTLYGCGGISQGNTQTITDMAGRSVSVPESVNTVFCTNPIGTVDLYALAPEKLVGWNFKPAGDNQKYIAEEYLELPSLGVWMGSGSVTNAEEIAAAAPHLLLCLWTADYTGIRMAADIYAEVG